MHQNSNLTTYLKKLSTRHNLSSKEAKDAFNIIMTGKVSNIQTAAFLIALRIIGETSVEITAICQTLLKVIPDINVPTNSIDIVGTGGSGTFALNVSTASSFLVASCGVPVAKHGSTAVSSNVGSSDVLQALGIDINISNNDVMKMLKETNFGFFMAPLYHSSMRHVAVARKGLAIPTIFNIVGPLVNPARLQKSLIGSYDLNLMSHMAKTKANLGTNWTWLVHGANNMDELTTYGINKVIEVKNNTIKEFDFDARKYGFTTAVVPNGKRIPNDLIGKDSAYNAKRIIDVFNGAKDIFRDQVVLNSAVALMIAEKVSTIEDGITIATKKLDDKSAYNVLQKCKNFKVLEDNRVS